MATIEGQRLYEVEVTVRVMVVAGDASEAERYVESDAERCVSDALRTAEVFAVRPRVLSGDHAASLPYIAEDYDTPKEMRSWRCERWQREGAEADAEAERVAAFDARQIALPGARS